MPGFSNITGDESIVFTDNASFDGTERGGKMTADGDLWIGSTVAPHVRKGTIASGDGTVVITKTAGHIDLSAPGSGSGGVNSVTTNSGTAAPAAGVLQVNGLAETTTSASGNTVSILSPRTAKFIVDPTLNNGTHQTIAAALTAASSGETIFIRPGTYTENLTLKAGVNLSAYVCDAQTPNVIIVGNATATFAGTCTLSGIRLRTNSANLLTVSGASNTIVNLINCYLDCTNNTGISYSSSGASSAIQCFYCQGDLGTTGIAYFASSGAGQIIFEYCFMGNTGASSTANTISAGVFNAHYCRFNSPISSSSTASIVFRFSRMLLTNVKGFTVAGSVSSLITHSFIQTGTATSITITSPALLTVENTVISSSNAAVVDGTGQYSYAGISYVGSTFAVTTATQTPQWRSNDAMVVKSPGAYPYTTIPQDELILVDTSSARTIIPLASPVTGQKHKIKDSVGSAATNNITITPSGKNIDGASSYVINLAYGSVEIIYNGTEWSIV